ncbi:MAG: hypothetical protein WAQ27_04110 [Candidatus Microsaccharimonas sp.]
MEPTHESNQSAEFDKNLHHILEAEDVVFALDYIDDPWDGPGTSDMEYIDWVYAIFHKYDGFGEDGAHHDAREIQKLFTDAYGDIYDQLKPEIKSISERLEEYYQTTTRAIADELNAFLALHPGLFLWSQDPTKPLNEIMIEENDRGELKPVWNGEKLFIDVRQLSKKHQKLIAKIFTLYGIK